MNMHNMPPRRYDNSLSSDEMSSDDGYSESSDGMISLVASVKVDEVKEVQNLSRRETQDVQVWRMIVLAVLLVTSALVSTGTYIFLQQEQDDDFVTSYYLFANTVEDAAAFHQTNIFATFRSMAETITASSFATGETFPFVTVPTFEVEATHARLQSGIEVFAFTPLIQKNEVNRWQQYANAKKGWIEESRSYVEATNGAISNANAVDTDITPILWERDAELNAIPVQGDGPFAPFWQTSPPPFSPAVINYNMFNQPFSKRMYPIVQIAREGIFSEVSDFGRLAGTAIDPVEHDAFHDSFVDAADPKLDKYLHPHSVLIQPVFRNLGSINETSEIIGLIQAVVPWDRYLTNLLPEGVDGITCVLKNTCGQAFTYELDGNRATYIGEGDFHEEEFEHMEVVVPFSDFQFPEQTPSIQGHCVYSFHVYPGSKLKSDSDSNLPKKLAGAVAGTFLFMALTFFMYDRFVRRRNKKIVSTAAKTNAIVSSLFPSNFRERLFTEKEAQSKKSSAAPTRLKNFLDDGEDEDDDVLKTPPIADLFPYTTILFMDIAGFTAWSSTREPAQVFTLLETLYRAFDEIAKKRRVFKVETIGDCYVAVTGLPDPRKDHAIAMARFARDCLNKMHSLTKKLEVLLGPDTADLDVRVGLHSGPVTAGVLRGERSRFQLFGDTMNTASRMESTGVRGRIQVSQETADLLVASGKLGWLKSREEKVIAKGKGEMQTYWLETERKAGGGASSCTPQSDFGGSESTPNADDPDSLMYQAVSARVSRLIGWNVQVLGQLLRQIMARRAVTRSSKASGTTASFVKGNGTVLEEVQEIIELPEFNAEATKKQAPVDSIELSEAAEAQLYDYVSTVASLYRENPFHNFEHASHVTMSVAKLMSRIVAPSDVEHDEDKNQMASTLHDHTYGITSDPLTQFAVVLSALVHDVDHTGVPNGTLVKENSKIAALYNGKSVAEQNSVDLSWDLLMDDSYGDLRAVIYSTSSELKRFRQLVVNSVMATDVMDKDLKELRNNRWAKAFEGSSTEESHRDVVNRKATIVIEHLIQASDVSHTMQHWHIYRKWNEKLFEEMYHAYEQGRSDKNPAEFWYQGEIGFFDFYIIPLAKKLKDCGVFGVSSDEYLNYALKNRNEWERRGREVVSEMVESLRRDESVPLE